MRQQKWYSRFMSRRTAFACLALASVACGSIAPSDPFPNEPLPPRDAATEGTCFLDCTSSVDATVPRTFTEDEASDLVIFGCVDGFCVERSLGKALGDRGDCLGPGKNGFLCMYERRAGVVSLYLRFWGEHGPTTALSARIVRRSDGGVVAEGGPASPTTQETVCNRTCWRGTFALVAPERDASAD